MTSKLDLASIVVLVKNEERNIGPCLSGIFRQERDAEMEVVVIDSGSVDATLDIARRFPVTLKQIAPQEFGWGRTRNLALDIVRGDVLVYLNADAEPKGTTWLQPLLGAFADDNVVGSFSRQLPRPGAYPMEVFFLQWAYGPSWRRFTSKSLGDGDHLFWFSNVSCAVRTSIMARFPFDEAIPIGEDQEWARRVLAAGYSVVYEPRSVVLHSHNYSLASAFRRYRQIGFAQAQYVPRGKIRLSIEIGLRYLVHELWYLICQGRWQWLPVALTYEATKYAGLLSGQLKPGRERP